MEDPRDVVAVLGAGSWGTALAILLARNGVEVRLWGHGTAHVSELRRARENRAFLAGQAFPGGLTPTDDLQQALAGAAEVLVVVPSHAFREVLGRIRPLLSTDAPLSWATKGLEPGSGKLLHQVAADELGERSMAVLSGPTFAREVAQGLPTAITVAATDWTHAERLAGYLHARYFRAYTSDDLIGVQIGGAAKNVLAIAAGAADGLGFGANTRAALITRGLAELMRLGLALGGRMETFMGLAGLGDLALTCTDDQSRNRRMGLALARGLSIDDARREIGQEVEGVRTAAEVHAVARRLGVEM
ncbi:MAG: NAD(P)H-dependent glycerol-3-phosphate dehydrogenase, partial [Chromatiales bacterium]